MKRGPAPKPLELKVLEGGRGNRPLNLSATFRPEVGLPPLPKGLSLGARKVWKRLTPELLKYNLMSVVFADAFEELCETIADVKELRHALRAEQARLRAEKKDPSEAFLTASPGGMPVQHPRYQILKSERQMMRTMLHEFGLTPAQTANVTTAIRAHLAQAELPLEGEPAKPQQAARPPSSQANSFAEFD